MPACARVCHPCIRRAPPPRSSLQVCRNLTKYGKCEEPDCPYKHDMEEIKECNMYKLGFCIYGPTCRYKHTRMPGGHPARAACVPGLHAGPFDM